MQDVLRSNHPTNSFTAWGKDAKVITKNQALDYPMGENSPLSRIYDRDSYILLLGVGYDSNTSFHLAEYRKNNLQQLIEGAPICEGGKTVWKTYRNIKFATEEFHILGEFFEQKIPIRQEMIGNATCKLLSQKQAVDFAIKWFNNTK